MTAAEGVEVVGRRRGRPRARGSDGGARTDCASRPRPRSASLMTPEATITFDGRTEPCTRPFPWTTREHLGDDAAEGVHLLEAQPAAARDRLGEVAPRHVLGDEAALALPLHEGDHLDEVGVRELGRGLEVGGERRQQARGAARSARGDACASRRCGRRPRPRRASTTPSGPRPISSCGTKRGARGPRRAAGRGGGSRRGRRRGGGAARRRRGAAARARRPAAAARPRRATRSFTSRNCRSSAWIFL